MGHVAPGKGTKLLVDSLMELCRRDVAFDADIIGRGPLLDVLKRRVADLGLSTRVTFHGFVEDHADVERLIAAASIAAAPYEDDLGSFTRFADPGKLRAYLAAGLPIVMTGVPPNATELSAEAGARSSLPRDARPGWPAPTSCWPNSAASRWCGW